MSHRTRRIGFLALLALVAVAALGAKCIENDSMYVDSEGYTHVVGHFTNDTDISATTVTLNAKLFNAQGQVIAETNGMLCPQSVQPKSQNVFDLRFPQPNIQGAVRYEVRPIAGNTIAHTLPESKLFLIRFEARRFGADVAVLGQVRNDSQTTYSNMSLCVAIYNNRGQVIRTLSHPIIGELPPGAAAMFGAVLEDVPSDAVQFRMWFATGANTQWAVSKKVTIQ